MLQGRSHIKYLDESAYYSSNLYRTKLLRLEEIYAGCLRDSLQALKISYAQNESYLTRDMNVVTECDVVIRRRNHIA